MSNSNIYDNLSDNLSENLSNKLSDNLSISQLRKLIIEQLKTNDNAKNDEPLTLNKWWLLGTSGCHLCDIAENTLIQFSAVTPISFQKVDISNFDEDLMEDFAQFIPVLITPEKQLNYPFSVVDLQALVD